MLIHKAIVSAMKDIAKTGIAKSSQASMGGGMVKFRGIEAAMNEMSVILIAHGITVTPAYSDLQIVERIKGAPADGKATRFVTLKGRFTFSAEDGSGVTSEFYGEAMDSGDKATTKAQSVAFRTALFQQFVVPTMAMDPEEDEDPGFSQECLDWVAKAEATDSEEELKKVAKEAVKTYFNPKKDSTGYNHFVSVVQSHGAALKKETANA